MVLMVSAAALASCSSSSIPTASTIQTEPNVKSVSTAVASTQLNQFGQTISVTNTNDSSSGSFRSAITLANLVGPSTQSITIEFEIDGTVSLSSGTIVYNNDVPLIINGNGVTIDGSGLAFEDDIFQINGGSDVIINDLSFVNGSANGVNIALPDNASGIVSLVFNTVTFGSNGLNGLLINDQSDDPINPGGSDSPASILLKLNSVEVTGNGFVGLSDFDGVRVNEGGLGDLTVTIQDSLVADNGGDGVELDEKGEGLVKATVKNSDFNDNGPQDPEDLEDGFDIDEADDGDLIAVLNTVTANGNFDEGIDLDESGPGDIRATLTNVTAVDNTDREIQFSEGLEDEDLPEDPPADINDGSIITFFLNVLMDGQGDDDDGGLLEEFGAGDVHFLFSDVTAVNADDGFQVDEVGDGDLLGWIKTSTFNSNADDGFTAEEQDLGDLAIVFSRTSIMDNLGNGIQAEQGDDGEGELGLLLTTIEGNDDPQISVDGVNVISFPPNAVVRFPTPQELGL